MNPSQFLTFLCPPQSGHTVLAAILDSHPDIAMAEEIFAVKRIVKRGWPLDKLTERILESSKQQANKAKLFERYKATTAWGSNRYKFGVFSPHQGVVSENGIVGDKTGWEVADMYHGCSDRVDTLIKLERRMPIPVKIIRMTRHPLDHISSWYIGKKKSTRRETKTLEQLIDRYKVINDPLQINLDKWGKDHIQLALEDLIRDPKSTLTYLAEQIGIEPKFNFSTIESKLLKKPNPQYDRIKELWTPEQEKEVWEYAGTIPSLVRYLG